MPSITSVDLLKARLGRRALSEIESGTIVVLPSITFPVDELRKISGIEYYEERMLFALLWLANPSIRIVYLSSMSIEQAILDYYFRFVDEPSARARLTLFSADDASPRPLSAKLLERPDLLHAVRAAVGDSEDAYILPFNVTRWEADIAEALDLPLYGPGLDRIALGSKTGARAISAEAGVATPRGAEGLYSIAEVATAVERLRRARPSPAAAVVKLNNGFSGQGNAIVDLMHAGSFGPAAFTFCSEDESWQSYMRKVSAEGAVVEELLTGPTVASPSAQFRIAPNGEFEAVSTHDQILGGVDHQVYLGCRFPALEEYRGAIQQNGLRIAALLAARGVIGLFGIDFVVVGRDGAYDVYLSEINLRLGGTTHPFFMARFLTGGRYDAEGGNLIVDGKPKYYVSSDNLKSPEYVGLSAERAIAAVDAAGIAFDRETMTGATLHLLGALHPYGKLGALCIGDSREQADEIYSEVVRALDATARAPQK